MPVQVLNRATRDEIYARTLAAFKHSIAQGGGDPDNPISLAGRCLDFAWEGYQVIKEWPGAPRTIIQAGSAQWPRIPPELDDGVSPTHFAYEWDSDSALALLARAGVFALIPFGCGHLASLPEMHVWLGCPDTGEVVDFSTGFWPIACEGTLGLPWLARPPDYFWDFGTRRPEGVNYTPDRDAIDVAVHLLRQQGRRYP